MNKARQGIQREDTLTGQACDAAGVAKFADQGGNKGSLSPDWTEWLMGWPIGWTAMEPIKSGDILGWGVDPADLDPSDPRYLPRISKGVKHRVARLKAIGNGQVPICAATAWNILMDRLGDRCDKRRT